MASSGMVVSQVQGVTIAEIQTPSLLEGPDVERLAQELFDLVDNMARMKVVVDFRNVTFMASVSIGKLVMLHKKACDIDGKVIMCGMNSNLMKIFKVMKLNKFLNFADDQEKALRKFKVTAAG